MLSYSGSLKVFVAVGACDLRKSLNALHGLVTEQLGEDPRQGALFVFTHRRRSRLKILCWDGTGLRVLTKLSLTPQALALLTDEVDLRGSKFRP